MNFGQNLKRSAKISFIVVSLLAHFMLAVAVNYAFPHYDDALITGGEVKRMDKDGLVSTANPADGPTRDVYFVYTQEANSTKVMPYRNEDTRWGFPFYFKFNSADVQAVAQSFAGEQKLVQVKFYGWRIALLDEFRNIISIREIKDVSELSNPIMTYVFYVLLLVSFGFSVRVIKRLFDK
ncbi:DUF1523 family protein [Campylobacter sp. RM13119]|uniref:DUF1523 family protein n=1 Tax=Campylobacter californiensis TaxID=1032243 RepID=UPI0014757845|nr:DUF1523 family protein [Campylobacter sp. RM13119]MBE3605807.1 DUF1523 family protein [Campylobacter sp. RM13119]